MNPEYADRNDRTERSVVDFNINIRFPALEKLLETKIMGTLQEINDKIDALTAFVGTVDENVEAMFELIKNAPSSDIKPEVADAILAKLTTLQDAADKITDDDPLVPTTETPPTEEAPR